MSSPEAKALLATWGMHPDFGPDVSAGAMFPFVEVFSDAAAGMSIVEGGASRMIDALAGVLGDHGGEVRTGAVVRRIRTDGGRATGVELASGERIDASRAVVASVTPPALYDVMLERAAVPQAVRNAALRYRFGPGTVTIHLALSGAPGLCGRRRPRGVRSTPGPPRPPEQHGASASAGPCQSRRSCGRASPGRSG
jgi:phytoene dehydrogenase-like protein